jgi:uncharacterized protein Veg
MKQKVQHVTIASLRDEFKLRENSEIQLTFKSKRGKATQITGIVSATYPKIFVIEVSDSESSRNMCFNYSDIVSGDVMVTV